MNPCRVGTLLAPILSRRVVSGDRVRLKWPNDVLIGEKKVCGTLIEMDGDHLLIGIGCNVMTAPIVGETGINGGRPSTSLSEHDAYSFVRESSEKVVISDESVSNSTTAVDNTCTSAPSSSKNSNGHRVAGTEFGVGSDDTQDQSRLEHYGSVCEELTAEITAAVADWVREADSRELAISEFESWMDFSPQLLRKEYNTVPPDSGSGSGSGTGNGSENDNFSEVKSLKGETIVPVKINSDGTLVVKLVNSGEEKVLIADYLW